MTNSIQKNTIRRQLLTKRGNLKKGEVIAKSRTIEKKLIDFFSKKDFSHFLVYNSVNNEVRTDDIFEHLIRSRKKIYLPTYIKTEDTWVPAEFKDFNDLESGPFKILQPKNPRSDDLQLIEVVILPGVAFDKQGVRLGYGKGVYDKLLADFRGLKIGLAYDFQIVEKISAESHDLIVDMVVGENSIINSVT